MMLMFREQQQPSGRGRGRQRNHENHSGDYNGPHDEGDYDGHNKYVLDLR